MEVLATIDELNQYLYHNVTIEGAAAAARELAYKLDVILVESILTYSSEFANEIDETSKAFRDMEARLR